MTEARPEVSLKQRCWHWSKWIFLLWLCLKIAGCLASVPGQWGPRVGGQLPNGSFVYFQSRPVGSETDDRLTWISQDKATHHFWVDRIHAGFGYVTIKFSDNGNHVWVESDGKVGASLDLETGDFRSEQSPQHAWAKLGSGTTLTSGATGSIMWLLRPW